jgi:hypothetical protein
MDYSVQTAKRKRVDLQHPAISDTTAILRRLLNGTVNQILVTYDDGDGTFTISLDPLIFATQLRLSGLSAASTLLASNGDKQIISVSDPRTFLTASAAFSNTNPSPGVANLALSSTQSFANLTVSTAQNQSYLTTTPHLIQADASKNLVAATDPRTFVTVGSSLTSTNPSTGVMLLGVDTTWLYSLANYRGIQANRRIGLAYSTTQTVVLTSGVDTNADLFRNHDLTTPIADFHSTSAFQTRFVASLRGGYFRFTVRVTIATAGTGGFQFYFAKNGAFTTADRRYGGTYIHQWLADTSIQIQSPIIFLAMGEYLTFRCFQHTGGLITLGVSGDVSKQCEAYFEELS